MKVCIEQNREVRIQPHQFKPYEKELALRLADIQKVFANKVVARCKSGHLYASLMIAFDQVNWQLY